MSYSSDLDSDLASELLKWSSCEDFPVVLEDTLCTSDFYEGECGVQFFVQIESDSGE